MGWIAQWQMWRARRQLRRSCFHHDHIAGVTWIKSELIDLGRGKVFWCTTCDKRWMV